MQHFKIILLLIFWKSFALVQGVDDSLETMNTNITNATILDTTTDSMVFMQNGDLNIVPLDTFSKYFSVGSVDSVKIPTDSTVLVFVDKDDSIVKISMVVYDKYNGNITVPRSIFNTSDLTPFIIAKAKQQLLMIGLSDSSGNMSTDSGGNIVFVPNNWGGDYSGYVDINAGDSGSIRLIPGPEGYVGVSGQHSFILDPNGGVYEYGDSALIINAEGTYANVFSNLTPLRLNGTSNGESIGIKISNDSVWINGDLVAESTTLYADSADYADTAAYAHDAGYMAHGVDSGYIPMANTDSTFGTSTAKMAGDTFQIKYLHSISDTFVNTSLAAFDGTVTGGCASPLTSDAYVCTQSNVLIQTGGTGAWGELEATGRNITGMAAAPNGDIYYCVYNGDIYKRTGGAGSFVALGGTSREWYGITVSTNGDVYACVKDEDIYIQEGATGLFIALGETYREWEDMCAGKNDDVWCSTRGTDSNNDIYKRAGGAGPFVAQGYPYGEWHAIASDTSGSIYAVNYSAYIYVNVGGTSTFVLLQTVSGNRFSIYGKPNGDMYMPWYQNLDIKTDSPIGTSFNVSAGKSKFCGTVEIVSPATSNNPKYILSQSGDTDFKIKKCLPESLAVDSARTAGNVGVIDTSYVDSDTLFYIVGSDTFFVATKK